MFRLPGPLFCGTGFPAGPWGSRWPSPPSAPRLLSVPQGQQELPASCSGPYTGLPRRRTVPPPRPPIRSSFEFSVPCLRMVAGHSGTGSQATPHPALPPRRHSAPSTGFSTRAPLRLHERLSRVEMPARPSCLVPESPLDRPNRAPSTRHVSSLRLLPLRRATLSHQSKGLHAE